MTDADVLRRAIEIMESRGWRGVAQQHMREVLSMIEAPPPSTLEEALRAAMKFIADEYRDPHAEALSGHFLAADARPVFAKLCAALAAHGTKEASREA